MATGPQSADSGNGSRTYSFGDFEICPAERRLTRGEEPVNLPPRVFDTLVVLVESDGNLVTKEELLRRVWPGTFVEESNLTVNISGLRKVLGNAAIQTVPKHGYRFIPKVSKALALIKERPAPPPRLLRLIRKGWVWLALVLALGAGAVSLYFHFRPYTIAVLPFANPAGSPIVNLLSEGLAKSVIDSLANAEIPRLRLVSYSLVLPHAGQKLDPIEAGRQLHADAVVIGRIVEREGAYATEVELISVRDGTQLWGFAYPQQDLVSIGMTQRAIAADLAHHLPIRVPQEALSKLERPRTTDKRAEELLVLAGVSFWRLTPQSLQKAVEYGVQAAEIDPLCADAYAQVAAAYTLMGITDVVSLGESEKLVEPWANKAAKADPGYVLTRLFTSAGADWTKREWKKIAALGEAYPFYDFYLIATDQTEKLLPYYETNPSPSPPIAVWSIARAYYLLRRYDEGRAEVKKAIDMDPSVELFYLQLADIEAQVGRYDAALAALTHAENMKRTPGRRGYVLALAGRKEQARVILQQLEKRRQTEYVSPMTVGYIHLGLGDLNKAMDELQEACRIFAPETIMVPADPAFDPLRTHPRYAELVKCLRTEYGNVTATATPNVRSR